MDRIDETRATRLGWPLRLFGPNDRRTDLERLRAGPSRWSKPVSGAKAWAAIGSTLIMVIGAVAMKTMDAPAMHAAPANDSSTWASEARSVATAATVVQLSGRVTAVESRLDGMERDTRFNTYILCELLRRSQPRALQPQECGDDEQRARIERRNR